MERLQSQLKLETRPEVYEHFDFIGGTGTGGQVLNPSQGSTEPKTVFYCRISATMLGRLRMPLDDAIKQFTTLAKNVFSDKKYFSASGPGKFKSKKMQQALKQLVVEATGDENTCMMDPQVEAAGCKT